MGISYFWNVCQMAQAYHCRVMPHATIGVGIAQAASLQVSAALDNFVMHEYQHSIFDRNLRFVVGDMRCEAGYFRSAHWRWIWAWSRRTRSSRM